MSEEEEKKLTRKQRFDKVKGDPIFPKNEDGRVKPVVTAPKKLRDFSDEEVLDVVAHSGGIIAHSARRLNVTPQALRNRLHKIPDGIEIVNEKFRADALDLAMDSVMHHLKEKDKDMTKYVMTALGAHMGFNPRTQIHMIDEKKVEIDITDDAVAKFKEQLQKTIDVTPPEEEE